MKFSKLVRRVHLYLALFLTPWLVVYASSGFVLNHALWFGSGNGHGPIAEFEKAEEIDYEADFSEDMGVREMAAQVLVDLGLPGAFFVQGDAKQDKLVIHRNRSLKASRVTWFRSQNRVIVENQIFSTPVFLNRTHFRHGYEQPHFASVAWAVIVDLVVLALIAWVLTGLWMWWEIRPARFWGGVFGLAGLAVFSLLLFTI